MMSQINCETNLRYAWHCIMAFQPTVMGQTYIQTHIMHVCRVLVSFHASNYDDDMIKINN